MPGRGMWPASAISGASVPVGDAAAARARVEKFLHEVLNTDQFPLTVMDRPIESETAKIVENSYRATILAYLHEWSLFAERNGRSDQGGRCHQDAADAQQHDLLAGIGGYCLSKDGGLGYWAYKRHRLRGWRQSVPHHAGSGGYQRHARLAMSPN